MYLMFETTDKDALINIWPQIENIPAQKFNLLLPPQELSHPLIDSVLLFLKLFPSGRTAFEASKNAFIKISHNAKEDPALMVDKSVETPYIIAILSNVSSNVKYYIDVENQLISVIY